MANNYSFNSGGIFTILTIIFVVLKLTNVITWSWWLVFLPLIIGTCLGLFVLIIIAIVAVWAISQS